VVIGSLTNQDYKVICTAIDPISTEKRKDDRMDMAVDIMIEPFAKVLTEVSQLPMAQQSGAPETDEELELFMQLNYKQATEIAMEEGIELAFSINNWKEISKRIIRDLVDISIGASKVYLDEHGIGIRYVDPAYMITSYTTNPDFKDNIHVGEVRQITIQELKRIAGNELSEEDYQQIAKNYLNKNGNPSSYSRKTIMYNGVESFDYDRFSVDILEGEFKSVDNLHYEKKETRYGGTTVNKKKKGYKPPNNLNIKENK